jgi:hypothetical protein
MTAVLSTLSSMLTPDMVGRIGKQLGLSDELTRQGVTVTNAVLAAGLGRAANNPESAQTLTTMLDGADTGLLSNLGSLAGALGGQSDYGEQIFGSNLELVTSGVKRATGLDIGPLIPVCTPVVLAVLKNVVGQQKLDNAGIANLLQTEVKGLSRRDAATSQVLKEVFKPLEAQDKLRANFTPDEWTALKRGPLNAAAYVMLADRSGGGGRKQEVEALEAALADVVTSAGATELNSLLFRDGAVPGVVDELVKEYRKASPEELQELLVGQVRGAVAIVRAKGSKSDATAYQGLILGVAQKVAGAAKEGTFLGMGGTAVSSEEKAALDTLAAAVAA